MSTAALNAATVSSEGIWLWRYRQNVLALNAQQAFTQWVSSTRAVRRARPVSTVMRQDRYRQTTAVNVSLERILLLQVRIAQEHASNVLLENLVQKLAAHH
tara:strand:+ start:504 stop:806 length:303 start_codon:yes stop_codon:yes gene_type:complete